jgi:hypothetical protein
MAHGADAAAAYLHGLDEVSNNPLVKESSVVDHHLCRFGKSGRISKG